MASIESLHPPESGFGPSKLPSSQFQDTHTVEEMDVSYAFPGERRKAGYHAPCALIIEVQERLLRGDTAIGEIRTAQQELAKDTSEMLDILHSAKAFFRIARWVGKIATFLTPIAALWLAWKGLIK